MALLVTVRLAAMNAVEQQMPSRRDLNVGNASRVNIHPTVDLSGGELVPRSPAVDGQRINRIESGRSSARRRSRRVRFSPRIVIIRPERRHNESSFLPKLKIAQPCLNCVKTKEKETKN